MVRATPKRRFDGIVVLRVGDLRPHPSQHSPVVNQGRPTASTIWKPSAARGWTSLFGVALAPEVTVLERPF